MLISYFINTETRIIMENLLFENTPAIKNNFGIFTSEQKEHIFENMSDGVMLINSAGMITYLNSACENMFELNKNENVTGKFFSDVFLSNKKNRAFNKFFSNILTRNKFTTKTTLRYFIENEAHHFNINVSFLEAVDENDKNQPFPGIMIMIEDVTDIFARRQHEHDCAYIFAGLIFCISLFLSTWSLLRFTLHIYLKSSYYTVMIEAITFVLFLEIVFLTSFSMRDIGLIPRFSRFKQNLKETIMTAAIICILLLISKLVLSLCGIQIKSYYIGGSWHGAYIYIFTAFVQEFLARGVIQTSVKSLMKVKYQKTFGIILTSLLFSLMHMPFGFYFMLGAFLLSLFLGYMYERQQDIWGCVLLHWACGYLAMCLYF